MGRRFVRGDRVVEPPLPLQKQPERARQLITDFEQVTVRELTIDIGRAVDLGLELGIYAYDGYMGKLPGRLDSRCSRLDGPIRRRDDARLVRGFERLGDLPGEGERLRDRQRAARQANPRASAPRRTPVPARSAHRPPPDGRWRRCSGDSGLRAAAASRAKRARRSGSSVKRDGSILIATSRPSLLSCARQTSPMPPTPSGATIV